MLSIKKFIFLIFVVGAYNIIATEKQIIVPYTPSFAAQHPNASVLVRALCATAAVPVGAKLCEKYVSHEPAAIATAGIGLGLCTWIFSRPKISLVDSVLTNQRGTLDMIYGVNNEMGKEAENSGLDKEKDIATMLNGVHKLLRKYEQKCPVLFLGECTSDCCILSRCVNPLYRNIFENRVSKKLVESIVARKNTAPVTYTSFGCGGAFMDFVILSKVLCAQPDANLNVHLIDMKHQCYMKTADYFKISREITQNSQLFDHNSQEFNDFIVYAKDVGKCKESHEVIKLAIINQSLHIYTQYHQLITWFKQTFPKANMRLFVHSETDEYLKYLDDHNIPHADVVTAADIQDDISCCFKAGLNYAKLCLKSLEKNPLCTNIWLAHNYQNGEICTISSQRPNTTMKIEEINEDDMVAYVAVENL